MTLVKNLFKSTLLASSLMLASTPFALADSYKIDAEGSHAFVQFKVKHLGYSWLYGRFNQFGGEFDYDPKNDANNKIAMTVDVTSLDSNHAERDKHLRGKEFFNTNKYPKATFVSTAYKTMGNHQAKLMGNLTLLGVTKPVTLDVEVVGGGQDPWGGYRQGFEARTMINAQDYGVKASYVQDVELIISVEGIKQ